MTVGELIAELNEYNKDQRVLLYAHGVCSTDEQDEVAGCFEEEIYDKDDNVIEKVVSLYEY